MKEDLKTFLGVFLGMVLGGLAGLGLFYATQVWKGLH